MIIFRMHVYHTVLHYQYTHSIHECCSLITWLQLTTNIDSTITCYIISIDRVKNTFFFFLAHFSVCWTQWHRSSKICFLKCVILSQHSYIDFTYNTIFTYIIIPKSTYLKTHGTWAEHNSMVTIIILQQGNWQFVDNTQTSHRTTLCLLQHWPNHRSNGI